MVEGIDTSSWPIWLIIVVMVLNLLKSPIAKLFPDWFGFLTVQANTRSRIEEIEAEGNRQDDVVLWEAMVRLQTEALRQNEKLLDFIIHQLDARISDLAALIKDELGAVRQELTDISQRWLAAMQQTSQSSAYMQLLRTEIVRLVDKMEEIERQILRLAGDEEE